MKRRLATLAAGASLLLCVGAVALWVRGYYRRDVITLRVNDDCAVWVETVRGGVQFVRELNARDQTKSGWEVVYPVDPLPSNTRFGFGAATFTSTVRRPGQVRTFHITALTLPSYAIAILCSILPVLWLVRCSRGRAALHQTRISCPACGYDLRATPDRCPECGAAREQSRCAREGSGTVHKGNRHACALSGPGREGKRRRRGEEQPAPPRGTMPRAVKRRLSIIAVAVSIVSLACIVAAWIAAPWIDPRKQFVSLSGGCHISLFARGADARLTVFNDANYGPYQGSIVGVGRNGPAVSGVGDVAGIYYRMIRWPDGTSLWTLSLSLAYPLLACAVLPVVWLIRRSRHPAVPAAAAVHPASIR